MINEDEVHIISYWGSPIYGNCHKEHRAACQTNDLPSANGESLRGINP